MIMDSLKRLDLGPIAFHSAFYFNVGQQLFSVIIFALYVLIREKYRAKIFSPLPPVRNIWCWQS